LKDKTKVTFIQLPHVIFPPTKQEKRFFGALWKRQKAIFPNLKEPSWTEPWENLYWVQYLAGVIRDVADCELVDLYFMNGEEVDPYKAARYVIEKAESNIYLVSPLTQNFDLSLKVCGQIKKLNHEFKIIAGGIHLDRTQHCDKNFESFDIILTGHCEGFLKEVLQNIHNIPIPYKAHSFYDCYFSKTLPDYSFNMENKIMRVYTTDVCANACAFCVNSNVSFGYTPVYKKVSQVINEIETLKKQSPTSTLFLADSTFLQRPKQTLPLLRELIGTGYKWMCQTRLDCLTPEIVQLLKEAGCNYIEIGFETADQKILNTLNKGTKIKQFEEVLRLLEDANIPVMTFWMLGLPGETKELFNRTVETMCAFLESGLCFLVDPMQLVPHPGSAIYNNPKKFGIEITSRNFELYRENYKPVYRTKFFSEEEMYENYLFCLEQCTKAMEGGNETSSSYLSTRSIG